MTLGSLDVVLYTCLFLVPGFIIDDIVNAFCTSKKRDTNIAILRYLMFSVIHVAIWSWAYASILIDAPVKAANVNWVYMFLLTVVGAFLTGTMLGLLTKEQFLQKLFAKLGIMVAGTIPTAWDNKFSTTEAVRWVIVYLACGRTVYGRLGRGSCASSDPDERDIYLNRVYTIDENNHWIEQPKTDGMLISKAEIRYIEFFYCDKVASDELESGTIFKPSRKKTEELKKIIRDNSKQPPDVGTAAMPDAKPAETTASPDTPRGYGVIYDGNDQPSQAVVNPSSPAPATPKPKKGRSPISSEPIHKDKDHVSIKPEGNSCHGVIDDCSPFTMVPTMCPHQRRKNGLKKKSHQFARTARSMKTKRKRHNASSLKFAGNVF